MNNKKKTNRSFIPKTIGETLVNVNQNLTNKYGKIDFIIYKKWNHIVGSYFAKNSKPIKISSIRNDVDSEGIPKFSNYLHVNVTPASSVEFQHFKDKIIEKINSYFGFKAIIGLKIQQNLNNTYDHELKNTKNENSEIKNNEIEISTKSFKNKDLEKSIVKLGLSINKEIKK